MKTYISLLRGINVSGQKKINMEELRSLYVSLGFMKVESYIQSGNVLFESDESNLEVLAKKIEKAIEDQWGFLVTVFVLTPKQLQNIVDALPFGEAVKSDAAKLHVTFLAGLPEATRVEALRQVDYGAGEWSLVDRVIYLYLPQGYGRTKLSNNFLESKLKVGATTRNWRTVNKLLEMVNG